ncbi:MAG: PepSY-like domain-containing protein [Bacteroidota bacterium]|nr:PepSY-like domain-containing protein [Bacteroidota bacterium]
MKKVFLITLGVFLICFSANAQKANAVKVPAAVKASFEKQFPKASDAKWEKEGAEYEVAIKNNGQEMTIAYDAKGKMLETELKIKSTELPAAVLKSINDKYKGKPILDAEKITAGEKITYEVVVQKGKALIYDANGKLLEQEKD